MSLFKIGDSVIVANSKCSGRSPVGLAGVVSHIDPPTSKCTTCMVDQDFVYFRDAGGLLYVEFDCRLTASISAFVASVSVPPVIVTRRNSYTFVDRGSRWLTCDNCQKRHECKEWNGKFLCVICMPSNVGATTQ